MKNRKKIMAKSIISGNNENENRRKSMKISNEMAEISKENEIK